MKSCPNQPLILTTLFVLLSFSAARDTITPSTPLADNATLVSSDRRFALGFFTPPDSNNRYIGLWYNLISVQTILWVANRENPLVNSTGLLSITKDGWLTISNQTSSVIWSTNSTKRLTNPAAQLLNSGNLIVKEMEDTSENYAWQGFNFLTDTLIPGMRLGVDFRTGINRTLTAWKSYNDPSPSTYHAYMDIRGDPEIYLYDGPKVSRSGAWVGTHFSGAPSMTVYSSFSFSFVNNASEVTYSYSINDRNLVSRLVLNTTGVMQRMNWLWGTNQWNILWKTRYDGCDVIGQCGPYGLCDSDKLFFCSCLHGFVPKNVQNWNSGDGQDGCVRKTKLDCKNETADGFMMVSNVKLPQSENAIVNMSVNLGQCQDLCLKNCSCNGYASANISGDGSGCMIWIGQLFDIRNFISGGQDLYVRLAAADLPVRKGSPVGNLKRKQTTIAVTIVGMKLKI